MAFRIYTKTGDDGTTGLFGGGRRSKADLRIEAYGTIDELNAHLGLLMAWLPEGGGVFAFRQTQGSAFRQKGNKPFGKCFDWLTRLATRAQHTAQDSAFRQMQQMQNELFVLGSMLATAPGKQPAGFKPLTADAVLRLEKQIDEMESHLPPLKNFILPGGSQAVAQAHVVRCVCRRAERLCVALAEAEEVDPVVLQYLNRLSDFFFVFARHLAQIEGVEEFVWQG